MLITHRARQRDRRRAASTIHQRPNSSSRLSAARIACPNYPQIALTLADSYRETKAHNECTTIYEELINRYTTAVPSESLGDAIVAAEIGSVTPGHITAWSHFGIAASLADRDVGFDDAARHLADARSFVDRMRRADEPSARDLQAACDDCEGCIKYKREQIPEAILLLEQSATLDADVETFWHLARAYARRAELSPDNWLWLSRVAEAHCGHVEEADVSSRYADRVTLLRRRLEELRARCTTVPVPAV